MSHTRQPREIWFQPSRAPLYLQEQNELHFQHCFLAQFFIKCLKLYRHMHWQPQPSKYLPQAPLPMRFPQSRESQIHKTSL